MTLLAVAFLMLCWGSLVSSRLLACDVFAYGPETFLPMSVYGGPNNGNMIKVSFQYSLSVPNLTSTYGQHVLFGLWNIGEQGGGLINQGTTSAKLTSSPSGPGPYNYTFNDLNGESLGPMQSIEPVVTLDLSVYYESESAPNDWPLVCVASWTFKNPTLAGERR